MTPVASTRSSGLRQLFVDMQFMSVSLAHFMADTLTSNVPLLLAYLSIPLGLGNAQIGAVASLYHIVLAVSQPLFGWLSDRRGGQWYAGAGLMWQAGLFLVAMTILATPAALMALPVLIVASVGSGAFHPVGTARATTRGLALMGGAATASSIFFLFGQVGLGIGPWIGGVLLDWFSLGGTAILAALALPVAVVTLLALRRPPSVVVDTAGRTPQAALASPLRAGGLMLGLFGAMIMLRMAPQSILMTFIPKLLLDRGFEASYQGAAVAALMIGSALGGVLGGVLADRFGRRNTIVVSLLLAVVPLYFLPVSAGPALFVLAGLAGAATGAPHSVIVVLAQSLLPNRMALASGLALGFMFATGAAVSWGVGLLAETYPLALMMQFGAPMALVGGLLALALKSDQLATS